MEKVLLTKDIVILQMAYPRSLCLMLKVLKCLQMANLFSSTMWIIKTLWIKTNPWPLGQIRLVLIVVKQIYVWNFELFLATRHRNRKVEDHKECQQQKPELPWRTVSHWFSIRRMLFYFYTFFLRHHVVKAVTFIRNFLPGFDPLLKP